MGLILTGGVSGVDAEVDASRNLSVAEGIPAHPAAGGWYTVSGYSTGIIAAALAANTMLMSARLAVGSTRKAYLAKFRLTITPATLGAAAGVAGVIGLVRFTAQTPTGGTVRTANRKWESLGSGTDITDIRDGAAALTGTAPTFGTVVGVSVVPLFVANAGGFEWIYEPNQPDVLNAGDGIALRTLVAMAATQTWVYTYTMHWFEK
jgi:hypothetical protein